MISEVTCAPAVTLTPWYTSVSLHQNVRADRQPNVTYGLRTVVLGLRELGDVWGFSKLHTHP